MLRIFRSVHVLGEKCVEALRTSRDTRYWHRHGEKRCQDEDKLNNRNGERNGPTAFGELEEGEGGDGAYSKTQTVTKCQWKQKQLRSTAFSHTGIQRIQHPQGVDLALS